MAEAIPPGRPLTSRHPAWPTLLARSPDPPDRLWVAGDVDLLSRPSVAVVGSRRGTGAGREMSRRIAAGLAARGVVVVSGCAYGVDAEAHRGALDVGGATVAVLGGGLDVAVPAGNRALAARIAREGCLASEHAPGVAPCKHHFPKRNRIIAGLCRIVVVVEAASRSGALITARLALEAGREVMAVPGNPLVETASGTNGLLCDGARPARSAEDVLHELEHLPGGLPPVSEPAVSEADPGGEPDPVRGSTPLVRRVLEAVRQEFRSADTLAIEVGAPVGEVLAALTELELFGLVRSEPGRGYAKPRKERAAARPVTRTDSS